MVPPLYFVLVAVIGAIELVQLKVAIDRRRPVLAFAALMFLVYFVFGGAAVYQLLDDYARYFSVDPDYLVRSGAYGVVVVLLVWIGYELPQRLRAPGRSLIPQATPAMLLPISVAGLAAFVLFIILNGGVSMIWARETIRAEPIPFQATLVVMADLTLIFPLVVYGRQDSARPWENRVAVLIAGAWVVLAAISGTSGRHAVDIAPFAILWISRHRPGFFRTLWLVAGGAGLISFLRFMRYLGSLPPAERQLVAALGEFLDPSNSLNLLHSVGEFFIFAKMIEVADDWGFQWGMSYLVVPMQMIPGVLWPEKRAFLFSIATHYHIPRITGFEGQMWPAGFYGEAYLNFGLVGVVGISILFGWALRRAELWLGSSRALFGLPPYVVGGYLAAAVIASVRQDVSVLMQCFGTRLILINAALLPVTFLRMGFTRDEGAERRGALREQRFRDAPGPNRRPVRAAPIRSRRTQ